MRRLTEERTDADVGERFGCGDRRDAREAEECVRVGGEVGEILGLGFVKIPRTHGVEAETGATDIDPIGGVGNLTHAGIGGGGLHALAATPSGGRGAGRLSGGGLIETCVGAAGVGEPAGVARVGGLRGGGERHQVANDHRQEEGGAEVHGLHPSA